MCARFRNLDGWTIVNGDSSSSEVHFLLFFED